MAKYDELFSFYRNFYSIYLYNKLQINDKKILKDNIKFKGIHRGKRCFIIGNGPSLKTQDITKLVNEYTFTVNQFMRMNEYTLLKNNYHVMADPLYFKLDLQLDEHRKILNLIKKINNHDHKPQCFFPLGSRKYIDTLGLNELNIAYFLPGQILSDKYNRNIDLTHPILSFRTVAQYAIVIAIYMGFNEIYLLGCDMTGYKEVEEYAYNSFSTEDHCYEISEEEKKNALHNKRTCEEWFTGFAKMFTDYRRLYDYCKRKGVYIYNLTNGGVLDSIPRKKYEDVISIGK